MIIHEVIFFLIKGSTTLSTMLYLKIFSNCKWFKNQSIIESKILENPKEFTTIGEQKFLGEASQNLKNQNPKANIEK